MIASIVVLNYQGEKTIAKTIDSLLRQIFPKKDYEIIIVDNNSHDKSRQIIDQYQTKYSKLIKKIYLPKNIGFGQGNNVAIKASTAKYVVLLNNDCIANRHWLLSLVKLADSDEKIFSVSSKIKRYPKRLNQIQNAGSIVFQDGYGRDIGAIVTQGHQQLYEIDDGQYNQAREVYSTCGASALYRKSILDKIGYFDDNYFMYYEDTELSERARLAGYQNFYSPKSVVYHHHAASSKEWSPFFIYHVEYGRLLHLLFHFPLQVFLSEFIKFTAKSILRMLRHPKGVAKNMVYLQVCLAIILRFPRLIFHRQSFNQIYPSANRKLNYDQILSGYWYFN